MKHTFDKRRAGIAILSCISEFMIHVKCGKHLLPPLNNYTFSVKDSPCKGDIVALKSAPNSEYCFSWYLDMEPHGNRFCDNHLLESILTGKLSYWHNVRFAVMNRELTKMHPEWFWTDRQFKLSDWWSKAVYKKGTFIRANPPEFFDNNKARLSCNRRFAGGHAWSIMVDDWKKLRLKDLYEIVESHKEASAKGGV